MPTSPCVLLDMHPRCSILLLMDIASLPFGSAYSALAWAVIETQRLDGLRASGSTPHHAGAQHAPGNAQADRLELIAVIWGAVDRIPARPRNTLLLVAQGLTDVEISGRYGCSDKWAGTLRKRALEMLEQRLKQRGVIA